MIGLVLHINNNFSSKVPKYVGENKRYKYLYPKFDYKSHKTVHEKNGISVIYQGLVKKNAYLSEFSEILSLYTQYKENIFNKLDSEYSLIIYDKNNKILIAGRDRYGVKPLYYYKSKTELIISDNIKYIKEKIAPIINNKWVYSSLTGVIYNKTDTFFQNIKKIPPAHYLKFENNKLSIIRYWKLKKQKINNNSIYYHIDNIRNLLIESVEKRIINKTGAELSGGLDSSSIVGILSKSINNLHTYSHALPDNLLNSFPPYNDEREYFNSVLNLNNITQYNKKIFCNNIGIFDIIKNELKIQSVPINNTLPYLSHQLLNLAKQDNIKTIFSGFGGDEGISNQGSFMLYYWARNFNIYKLIKYNKNFVKHIINAFYTKNNTIIYNSSYFFMNKEFVLDNKLDKMYINHFEKKNYKNLSEFIYHKLDENYIPNRIELFQQTATYRGINYSFPLLDHKLLEYYYSIPDNYKYYNASKRYIFKEAIKDFIPKNVLERNNKYGATVPNVIHRFMIDYDKIYDYLQASKTGKASEFIDIEKMIKKMELIKHLYNGNKIRANQHIFFNALMLIMYLNKD